MNQEYRVLWYEKLAGLERPIPFSGRVRSSYAEAHVECLSRMDDPRCTRVTIEGRDASDEPWPVPSNPHGRILNVAQLETWAMNREDDAVAAEREECAVIAEDVAVGETGIDEFTDGSIDAARSIAAAIRARGKQ